MNRLTALAAAKQRQVMAHGRMTSYAAYRRREALSGTATAVGYLAAFIGLPMLIALAAIGNEPPPRPAPPPPDLEISADATQRIIAALRVCPLLLDDVQKVLADRRIVASEALRIAAHQRALSSSPVTAPACAPEAKPQGTRP